MVCTVHAFLICVKKTHLCVFLTLLGFIIYTVYVSFMCPLLVSFKMLYQNVCIHFCDPHCPFKIVFLGRRSVIGLLSSPNCLHVRCVCLFLFLSFPLASSSPLLLHCRAIHQWWSPPMCFSQTNNYAHLLNYLLIYYLFIYSFIHWFIWRLTLGFCKVPRRSSL